MAIVTPVHNRREITLRCLWSLREIDRVGLDVRIIVVDDGSTDGTGEAIRREFPEVEIIEGDGNLWYTAGTNRGIEAAMKQDPDYVLAINDDSVFDPQFLQRMVQCAEDNPRSVVGALLLRMDKPDRVMQVDVRWDTWYGGWRHRYDLTTNNVPKEPWEVEVIVGNCVLYPCAVIREVGLMNERAFPQYGDVEYTPRMRKGGWHLLVEPRAWVFCQRNDVPPPFREQPLRRQLKILLVDRRHPLNLFTMFRGHWASAPSHMEGVAAFCIRMARMSLRRMGILKNWPAGSVATVDGIR